MSDKSLVRVPDLNRAQSYTNPTKSTGGLFDFFYFPLGSSFIFIAIIGSPKSLFKMSKFASGLADYLKTRYPKTTPKGKLGSGVGAKGLLIPFMYCGIEGILSGFRGVDDNMNIITAGTLTGALYKIAFKGNFHSWGNGGLLGLALSSLYCLYKEDELNNNLCQEYKPESNFDDPWDK